MLPFSKWCVRGLKTLTSSLLFSLKSLVQFTFQRSHFLLQAVSHTQSLLSHCHYLSPSRHHFPTGHAIILLPSLLPFLSICHTRINFQYELNSIASLLRIFKGFPLCWNTLRSSTMIYKHPAMSCRRHLLPFSTWTFFHHLVYAKPHFPWSFCMCSSCFFGCFSLTFAWLTSPRYLVIKSDVTFPPLKMTSTPPISAHSYSVILYHIILLMLLSSSLCGSNICSFVSSLTYHWNLKFFFAFLSLSNVCSYKFIEIVKIRFSEGSRNIQVGCWKFIWKKLEDYWRQKVMRKYDEPVLFGLP